MPPPSNEMPDRLFMQKTRETMSYNPRAKRHYKTSQLPTLTKAVNPSDHQDILFTLYREVCSSWRMLTDVRFKLLGFIPVISGVVLFSLLSNKSDGPSPLARIGIALFGLLITVALFVYDKRNSELYDDMISRGRKIEEELGVDTGLFLGRRGPSHKWIKHDTATTLIYGTSFGAWLMAFLLISFGL
jgi:hypothetical protein